MLEGYYQGIPSRVNVRFFHENQKLAEPEIVVSSLDGPEVFGSAIVSELLFDANNERFARFRKKWNTASLAGAVEICKTYILACSCPEALEVDKDFCAGIGGHIHVATITRASGFKWAPGLEPVT